MLPFNLIFISLKSTNSLDSFIKQDVSLARSVLTRDDQIDALKDQIFRELLTFMIGDNSSIPRALELILVSRHLERIGDHATNIAEDVIYMTEGIIARHRHEDFTLGDKKYDR